MAWKTPTPRKPASQPPTPQENGHDTSYPGLKPSRTESTPQMQYTDVQNDEVMVLQSMYLDDFIEHKATNSAWQTSEPSFDLRLRAHSSNDFSVTLGIVLTATYPKSVPLLSLKDDGNLSGSTQFKLQKFIETKPRAIVAKSHGEPFMVDLAEGIQDLLEDAAQAKAMGTERSLEEERAAHEAELAKQAQELQQQEERKRQDAELEEEKAMQDRIQKEVERQRLRAKESKRSKQQPMLNSKLDKTPSLDDSRVEFDQLCEVHSVEGEPLFFSTVSGRTEFRKGAIATISRVWPNVSGGRQGPSLALKEFELWSAPEDSAQLKKQLQALEVQLESLKGISHRNIAQLLSYRIDRNQAEDDSTPTDWTVRILTPIADKGPLDELLDLAGTLEIGRIRSWTADLLNALGHLHNHGVVHQDIHPGNVLLHREPEGEIVPKLADVAYQRDLQAIYRQSRAAASANSARSTYWLPPEIAGSSKPHYSQKTDVWDLGVVLLQMIFGLDVCQRYQSPAALMESLSLSRPLHELVTRFFKADPKKRYRAFELGSSEFLATDAAIMDDEPPGVLTPSQSLTVLPPSFASRTRHDSATRHPVFSRYREDFIEEGRLGKGGFGEVVKARKKLDGQIYAIKKITQHSQSSLTEVLKEVRLLSQISHPAVVRYYNTWLEEIPNINDGNEDASTESAVTEGSQDTVSQGLEIQFTTSTGGLDFMSSSGVEFELNGPDSEEDEDELDEDDDEDDDDEDEDEEDSEFESDSTTSEKRGGSVSPRKNRTNPRRSRTVMYISMEYCDKKTLRNLINANLKSEEMWRLFRQILEGLAHIHGLNIVHRDLKPDNVFIGLGPDGTNNVKIGDFGLATTGHFAVDKATGAHLDSTDMTRSIGTSYYVAPEVRTGGGSYTSKVDMYSLGIIFFEMNYHPMIGMERAEKLGNLGNLSLLPEDFSAGAQVQSEIIRSLVTHDVSQRPTSAELLRSGKLPVQMENETTRRALASLTDTASPYYAKVVSSLFAQPVEMTKDFTWEVSSQLPPSSTLLHQEIVKDELMTIFRRHGAVESSGSFLYPRSPHYSANQNVAKLLDSDGTVVQLPFDLMLGNARALAKHTGPPPAKRSYTFGNVFRARQTSGQPFMAGEADFDIVSSDTLDLALKEAEVIKVLDEIVDAFPSLSPMCFHLGHSDLLHAIFDFCNVDFSARRLAAETLSKLNFHSNTFQKVRAELRSPLIGVSATSIEDLKRFDFRDTPSKAIAKLKAIFEGSPLFERIQPTLAHLKDVVEYTKRLGVHAKIYFNPLSSVKENFFKGGILIQCIYDKKFRDIFAAGGRYDSLIRAHRPKMGTNSEALHAVGVSLAWEKIARIPKAGGSKNFVKRSERTEDESQGIFHRKRCDVLVASFDPQTLRTTGIEMVSAIWASDMSAELARDARSTEDLYARNREESYAYIVVIKQDSMVKIRTMDKKDVPDVDLPITQTLAWLKAAVRERTYRQSSTMRQPESTVGSVSGAGVAWANPEQEVKIHVAQTRSKKTNRQNVIEQAQFNAATLAQSFLDGPIVAVETSDVVLDLIQGTSLTDAEMWRRAEQSVDKNEKRYMREIHDLLLDYRSEWEANNGSRHAFLYNFRTTKCIYYDLGA